MPASPEPTDLLWQPARIVDDESGDRWLEFESLSECAACRAGTGCGASYWTRLFGKGPVRRMPLPPECTLPAGTAVRAALPAAVLVRTAARLYLLPLLAFLAALAGLAQLGVPEPAALLLAVAIACGVLLWARDRGRSAGGADASSGSLRPFVALRSDACPALESGSDRNHL